MSAYPRAAIIFLICEGCERMAFSTINCIASLYMKNKLFFTENNATIIYHTMLMFAFSIPLLGGIIADSCLGKLRTIILFYVIYVLWSSTLTLTAIKSIGNFPRELSVLALIGISFASGGLRACTVALAAEQFKIPEQEKELSQLFSWAVVLQNSGSAIANTFSPVIKDEITCFGEYDCYLIPFATNTILVYTAFTLYSLFGRWFETVQPEKNVLFEFFKCTSHAIIQRCKTNRAERNRKHWTEYADDKYSAQQMEDVKIICRLAKLFLTFLLFWGFFGTLGSMWQFQATMMNGVIADGLYILRADQMMAFNPVFGVCFIPILNFIILPLLEKLHIPFSLLTRIGTAIFIASLAFLVTGCLQVYIQSLVVHNPDPGFAELRIYNTLPCSLDIKTSFSNEMLNIGSLEMYTSEYIKTTSGTFDFDIEITAAKGNEVCDALVGQKATKQLKSEKILGIHVIEDNPLTDFEDDLKLSRCGSPSIRLITNKDNNETVHLMVKDYEYLKLTGTNFDYVEIPPKIYNLKQGKKLVQDKAFLKMGGIYTIIANKEDLKLVICGHPNEVHILWQLPQYLLITIAEMLFSISGPEFAFREAPVSARAIIGAMFFLMDTLGNVVVITYNIFTDFEKATNFFVFSTALMINFFVFVYMSRAYLKKASSE